MKNNDISASTKPIEVDEKFEIMIVDDDETTLEVFSEYLELVGHKIIAKAYDGRQAAEMYRSLMPDFVFMDIMMPKYDGFYGLEKIKNQDPNATIIAVTADLTKETDEKLEDLRVDAIVYKPFDMDAIFTIMKKIYEKKIKINK